MISPGKFVDEVWDLYRHNAFKLWSIASWFGIISIITIILLFLTPVYNDLPFVNTGTVFTPWQIAIAVMSFININVLAPLLSIWIIVAIIRALDAAYRKQPVESTSIVKTSGRFYGGALLITVLTSLIQTAAFLVPLIPGIILIAWAGFGTANGVLGGLGIFLLLIGVVVGIVYLLKFALELAFSVHVYVLQEKGMIASMKESSTLIQKHWLGSVLALGLSFVIIAGISIFIGMLAFRLGQFGVDQLAFNPTALERTAGVLDALITWGFYTVFTPLAATPVYVLYRKLLAYKAPKQASPTNTEALLNVMTVSKS